MYSNKMITYIKYICIVTKLYVYTYIYIYIYNIYSNKMIIYIYI